MLSLRTLKSLLRTGLAATLALSVLAALVLAAWSPSAAAAPSAAPASQEADRYFPQTQHLVRGPLLAFFDRFGGLDRWGQPLTEQYDEGGRINQVFERGALQYDPATGGVWARAIGSELVAAHAVQPPVAPAGDGSVFVAETGHNIGQAFANYWQSHAGPARLGKPISEQMNEGTQVVQYFEFARLVVEPTVTDGVVEELEDNVRS